MTVKEKINKHYSGNSARIIGDLALILIPVLQTIVNNAPDVSDHVKYWMISFLTSALVVVKFASKLWQSD